MQLNRIPAPARGCHGFTLIEVLVTIVLILLGIIGVMGLQVKASSVELESYQRGQALSLARDLAARIADSRNLVGAGSGYLDNSLSSTDGSVYVGTLGNRTTDLGACANGTTALQIATYEMCIFEKTLQGAAEGATPRGTMIGALGCLIRNDTAAPTNAALTGALADLYVVIVWRGVASGKEPLGTLSGETATPASKCASAVNYGSGLRRGVSVRVLVPNLQQGTSS